MAARNQRFSDPRQEFDAIATRYSPMLYRMALRKLGNPEDAEDAVQDALLLAFRHISQFEGRAQMSTWLGRIVINSARMHLRRHRAHTFQSLDAADSGEHPAFTELLMDRGPSPFEVCQKEESRRIFYGLLGRLPAHLRYAIQLCKVHGLPQKEAAEVLNVKIGTVKCQLHRAHVRLTLLLNFKGSRPMVGEQEDRGELHCNP